MTEFGDHPTSDYQNELELQFLGLQRSGNHAILAWLFRQFDEPVYFFNNAKHFGNPLQEFRPLDLPNTVKIRRGEASRRELEEIGQRKKGVLAYSYENLPLSELRRRELVPNKLAVTGSSRCLWRILVIRDFENWLASRIRYREIVRAELPSLPQILRFAWLWAVYAREYLGETDFIGSGPLLRVSFNRWVQDEAYRCELLRRLGMKMKDSSISYVPHAGGGSSFDATTFSGNAEQMQVFERWRYLREGKLTEIMSALRKRYPDVGRLNEKIFGENCYVS